MQGRIIGQVKRVNGPVLIVKDITDAAMMELVHVGEGQIVGEIVKLSGTTATVQVYEDATGIAPGDNVYGSGMSLSCQLGPGLIGNIYDGIQRPLEERGRLAILARQDALHLVVRVEINPDRGRPAETTDVTGIRPAVDEPPRRASAQGA